MATRQYKGDKIEALIALLNSETQSLKNKNDAIRTLKHMGDKRALPVLNSLLTGTVCDHDKYVCQWSLNRAIKHIEKMHAEISSVEQSRKKFPNTNN